MEIVLVLVIALLVFGPNRLPQAGRSLGHAIREFRKATETARTELGLDEVTKSVDDLKSSFSLDLNSSGAAAPRQDAAAVAAAVAAAPPADKPVPVAAAGTDTTPVALDVPEVAPEPATAAPEPAQDTNDDIVATGAAVSRDEA
jgi:TatA/E family protein of Tat protein translocase